MTNAESTKAFEKSLVSSQISLETHEQSSQSHPLTRNILRRLPNISTNNSTSTEQNEATDEIEAMSNLLTEMQKENDERSEMLISVFDKNFDAKIKTCIDTRAEMEARATAFETIIQSETLIKKPVKEITTENTYEGVFGTNFSQTGSTSDGLRMSPMEQQQFTSQHIAEASSIASQLPRNVADVTSPSKVSPNKVESEQILTEQAENAGKKITKGFGEAALTKVGHWSKSAFNFFRTKNISSGKDATMLRKTAEKATHVESDRSHVKDAKIEIIPQENFRQTRRTRQAKSRSYRETKGQKPKKTLRRSLKHKQSKKDESVLKMSIPTELGNTSNELKKHAAKLTEAKRRLKERNEIKFKKKKKSNLETKGKRSHKYDSRQNLIVGEKKIKKSTKKIKKMEAQKNN
ncbi:unnamed protein product [Cercopithifilaria johnstoni]|uniref:Uncharacterized protein n=1 Tax=Cercopithifilaria johnstoni TaxID=2874296 RepID=A0A8J2Q8X5_9BILA|nr:unnamed protein product [Cercopithifilaria johnstoni]